jgi:hypothetical protein
VSRHEARSTAAGAALTTAERSAIATPMAPVLNVAQPVFNFAKNVLSFALFSSRRCYGYGPITSGSSGNRRGIGALCA